MTEVIKRLKITSPIAEAPKPGVGEKGAVIHQYSRASHKTLCGRGVPEGDPRWVVNRNGAVEDINCASCLHRLAEGSNGTKPSKPSAKQLAAAAIRKPTRSRKAIAAEAARDQVRAVPKPTRTRRSRKAAQPEPNLSQTQAEEFGEAMADVAMAISDNP